MRAVYFTVNLRGPKAVKLWRSLTGYLQRELKRYNILIEEDRISEPAPLAKELNEIEVNAHVVTIHS